MALNSELLRRVDLAMRLRDMQPSTMKSYRWHLESFIMWTKIAYGEYRDPRLLGKQGLEDWLSWLANVRDVAASTQNVALQAALFMFNNVLDMEITGVDAMRAIRPKRLPVVLSVREAELILGQLKGRSRLIGMLLYGAGLRIGEAISLRLKDLDFDRRQITIRCAKGKKDRCVMMPVSIIPILSDQVDHATKMYDYDVDHGTNRVEIPNRLSRKYPQSQYSLTWYWLFPSHKTSKHPRDGWTGRFHIGRDSFSRSLSVAVLRARVLKHVTPHKLRHSFASHCHDNGMPLADLSRLLGHTDLRTTQIYLHSSIDGATANQSPLDRLRIA